MVGLGFELSLSSCRTWLLFDFDAFVVSWRVGEWGMSGGKHPLLHPLKDALRTLFMHRVKYAEHSERRAFCPGATFVVCWPNCRKLVLTPDRVAFRVSSSVCVSGFSDSLSTNFLATLSVGKPFLHFLQSNLPNLNIHFTKCQILSKALIGIESV